MLDKDDEVKLKIRQALEKHGKFALYEALVGAKRPVTEIAKNPETGKWMVTTLVDKNGAPVLKPVSAFDIDRNFSKFATFATALSDRLEAERAGVSPGASPGASPATESPAPPFGANGILPV